MAKGKSWFGKRWTKSFIRWMDGAIFHLENDPDFKTCESLFCSNFTFGIAAGVATLILSLFMDQEKAMVIAAWGMGILLVGSLGWYLYTNLKFYDTVLKKIARVFFLLILCGIASAVGYVVGIWGAIIAVVLFFLTGMLFGSSSSSGRRNEATDKPQEFIDISGGSTLHASDAVQGESYIAGDGNVYQCRGGFFHKL